MFSSGKVASAVAVLLRPLLAAALALTLFAAPAEAKKPPGQSFRVYLNFIQMRPWTYSLISSSSVPQCTTTDTGNGQDDANLYGKASMTVRPGVKSVAGFGLVGTYRRDGVMNHKVEGADCESKNTNEATDGCVRKKLKVVFATVELSGKKLRLKWESNDIPSFQCPFFLGADSASEASSLPLPFYRNLTATISPKALQNRSKHEIKTSAAAHFAGHETCGSLEPDGCAAGDTYDATGSVDSSVEILLVRR